MFLITFDEDDGHYANHIFTLAFGDMVKANAVDSNVYNHYSWTRTVEENWGLGDMGRHDATATSYKDIWA